MMLTHKCLEQYLYSPIGDGLREFVSEAIQFDFGEFDKLPVGRSEEVAFARAPYKKTVVQFFTPDGLGLDYWISFVEEIDDGVFVVVFAQRDKLDHQWVAMYPLEIRRTVGGFEVLKPNGGQLRDVDKQTVSQMFWAVLDAFYVIGCSNVELADNKPPAALNKKRAKAGKLPLFEYKTLVLKVGKGAAKSSAGGGTHASPRVHLRRGHVRRLDAERRVWVQACVVGSGPGMIHKDYRVDGGQ